MSKVLFYRSCLCVVAILMLFIAGVWTSQAQEQNGGARKVTADNAAGKATTSEPMRLFPDKAPGEPDDPKPETSTRRGNVTRITNVSVPTLTIYHPEPGRATGSACIVCPGGGYHILAWDKEGTEVAEWLQGMGMTAALLKYRVPRRESQPKHLAPLQDAQRAISTVRHNAEDWQIDPKRIGIMGFSAGGHLSAAASTSFDQRAYEPIDDIDNASCRPDFAMLIYPAYLVDDYRAAQPKLAEELDVTEKTPPTIILGTADDIHMRGAPYYYLALLEKKVPVGLHVYPKGGHGYGLRPSDHVVSTWPRRCEDWLRSRGLLDRK